MNTVIFYFLYSFIHQSVWLDGLVVFFAVYFPVVVIVLAVVFLLFHHEVLYSSKPIQEFKKKWKEIITIFFSGVVAWGLAVIFKLFFSTLRPFDLLPNIQPFFMPIDHSFPSGHATFFFGLGFSLFFMHKKAGSVFLFFAVLISLARVMSGVHFPVDIIGGLVIGFIISYVFKDL